MPARISPGLVVLLAACASAAPPPPPPSDPVIAASEFEVVRGTGGSNASRVMVKGSQDDVFDALKAVYSDLGIEVLLQDPRTGQLGNRNFHKTRRLAGESLSKFVGCGMTMSGEAADQYEVRMSLVSVVTPAINGSNVETQLNASARDMGPRGSGGVSCVSKGSLEAKVSQLLLRRIPG